MIEPLPVTRRTKSVREAAEIIGISYDKALDLIRAKELRAKWVGNKYLVPDTAITAFLGEEGTS